MDIGAITMASQMRRVETIAHNIANASTAGFKRQVSASSFAAAVQDGAAAADLSLPAHAVHSDLSAGRLTQTSNPAHLALSGKGFFVVRNGDEMTLTRAGAFERDAQGRLVDSRGGVLQGEGGDIGVRSAAFRVEPDGTVIEEQRAVGRVLVVNVENPHALARGPASSFLAGESAQHRVDDAGIKQGYLEMANVDLGHEMVQMIEAMRRFELGQKLVMAHEDMMERAVRRLGDLQS
jgi:flagellar basal-body rod protein FlgG